MNRSISELADAVKERVRKAHYAPSYEQVKMTALRNFVSYADNQGAAALSLELVESFEKSIEDIVSPSMRKATMHMVRMMCDEAGLYVAAFDNSAAARKSTPRSCEVPARFEREQEAFLAAKKAADGVGDKYLANLEIASRQFLVFLDDRIESLDELTIEDCDAFVEQWAEGLSERGLSSYYSYLKQFVAYVIHTRSADARLVSFIEENRKSPPEKTQRFLTEGEMKSMLAAAKDSRRHPKRTLLIVAMLLQYTMRGIDLRKLSLDDIDWDRREITIRSSKNGRARVCELTENMGYIIRDYVKNERPADSPHKNLLLCSRYPYGPVKCASDLAKVLRRVARAAGIEIGEHRFGCHVVRRTGATTLMGQDVDYPVISEMLIHDISGNCMSDTTMVYLKFDIPRLRQAALEVKPRG